VEAACGRALEIGARSYTSVNSILNKKLDAKRPAAATANKGRLLPASRNKHGKVTKLARIWETWR
jgi:hypothetical protein